MAPNAKRSHVPRVGPSRGRHTGVPGRAITVLTGLLTTMAAIAVGLGTAVAADGKAVWTVIVVTLAAAVAVDPLRRRWQRWLLRRADPRRQIAAALTTQHLRRMMADTPYEPPSGTAGHVAQETIRAAFDDPHAVLMLALPDNRGWVDVDDRPAPGPLERHDGHIELVAGAGGQVIAYFLHGSDTAADRAGAAGVVDELRVLIERAVFRATVRDQAERIVQERERAEQAALAERVRLERDLHDGVQGRLLALALNLQMARHTVADPATGDLLKTSVQDLRIALDDLRGVAAGRAPVLLTRRGLAAAVEDLASKLPRPVEIDVVDERFAPGVEAVAYFAVAEALTNAVKHAEAQRMRVRVTAEPTALRIEVADDGRGGADPDGAGLRGLRTRVALAGGAMHVEDRPGGGTAIRVDLPRRPGDPSA
ncbi:sensor histidine kinase [Catellatospora vulcania]|uniref:sensor histidine kinase n=1 Tax=Catellatospora vulcania TaxID=1460450 RepID=UPI0018AF5506|nr:ATP-binding protein [Catellatospora vulcania]